MRRTFRLIAYSLLAVLLVLLITLYALYLSAQRPPKFYRDNLEVAAEIQQERNKEMLKKIRLLNNDVQKTDVPWEGRFSNEEINGYLTVEVGKASSNLFPPEIKEPRLHIGDRQLDFACRIEQGHLTGILHFAIDAAVTEPNLLTLRLKHVALGRLPIAAERPAQLLLDALRSQGYTVTEGMQDGDPTFTIPLDLKYGKTKKVNLESVELLEGGIRISGTSDELRVTSDE